MFRIGVRDSAGAQTVLARHARLDVQESAIMRFIGSLASHAMGDLDTKVEIEEDRFIRDRFTALQADLRAWARRADAGDRKQKTPRSLSLVASGGREILAGTASRAVIGTLRPTERRRAKSQKARNMPNRLYYRSGNAAMELTGIEPVASAVRLQRSPS